MSLYLIENSVKSVWKASTEGFPIAEWHFCQGEYFDPFATA